MPRNTNAWIDLSVPGVSILTRPRIHAKLVYIHAVLDMNSYAYVNQQACNFLLAYGFTGFWTINSCKIGMNSCKICINSCKLIWIYNKEYEFTHVYINVDAFLGMNYRGVLILVFLHDLYNLHVPDVLVLMLPISVPTSNLARTCQLLRPHRGSVAPGRTSPLCPLGHAPYTSLGPPQPTPLTPPPTSLTALPYSYSQSIILPVQKF